MQCDWLVATRRPVRMTTWQLQYTHTSVAAIGQSGKSPPYWYVLIWLTAALLNSTYILLLASSFPRLWTVNCKGNKRLLPCVNMLSKINWKLVGFLSQLTEVAHGIFRERQRQQQHRTGEWWTKYYGWKNQRADERPSAGHDGFSSGLVVFPALQFGPSYFRPACIFHSPL